MPPWVPTAWPCQRQRPWPGGHSPFHPERPTSLRAQMPPLSCSPPPASGGHGAAGGGISLSHAQRPPHSSPEGSGRPHLSGERSLLTQPLSCPYTHGWGGCIALQLGAQHPDPSRRSGTRWAAQRSSLRPQLRSGLGDTGTGCLGSGVMAGAVRPGSGGSRSPRQGLVVEGTPRRFQQVRGRGQQSCASSPGLRPERGLGARQKGSSVPETSDTPRLPAQGRWPLGAPAGEPRELVTRRADDPCPTLQL